jgi:hypothetical protein
LACVIAAVLLAAGCGSDDDGPKMYEVRAVDYAYEGLPEKVAIGSTFTLVNKSTAEVHEMYAARLPAAETRPVEELLQLSEEEQEALGTADVFLLVALPGEEGTPVFGDGTFAEPGRYVLICFIPSGADPEAVLAALESQNQEPPDLGDGAPHVSLGMFVEVTVE